MYRIAIGAIAVALTLAIGLAYAQEFKLGSITVEQPWSRATPGGAQVAAGYLTIKNESATPDYLVAATSEVAERIEIHQMTITDGVAKMRPLAGGLPIPASGSVALKPGSYHLMFMDLAKPLREGEQFSATLTFQEAGSLSVTFDVEAAGAAAPNGANHH